VILDSDARRKTLRYWVDYAKQHGGDHKDAYQTFDHLQAEWPNLESAAALLRDLSGLPVALKDRQAARMLSELTDALQGFLQFRGYWDEWARLGEWAYQAAQALQDWSGAGWRAHDVAWIHYHRAETDRAAAWAGRMDKAMAWGGDRGDRAEAARMRGLVAEQRGDLDEAERLYHQALDALRELRDEEGQAIVLNSLGSVAQERRDYDRAEAYYRQSLTLDEKRGQAGPGYQRGQSGLAGSGPGPPDRGPRLVRTRAVSGPAGGAAKPGCRHSIRPGPRAGKRGPPRRGAAPGPGGTANPRAPARSRPGSNTPVG
jgi:tetratricopeptide (TPR) repeat protein